MKIQEYVNLNTFSSFMLSSQARYFCIIESLEDIYTLCESDVWKNNDYYILGGGSNTLFVGDLDKLIIKNQIEGLEVIHENEDYVDLCVGAGEDWHNLVMYTVDQHWWGLENLALIPGTVGASPVQNIGAYGVEVQEHIYQVEAFDTQKKNTIFFSHEECNFSYRDSLFKHEPGRYFITRVFFRLSKKAQAVLSYPRVEQELERSGIKIPQPMDIAQAVIRIRDSKLPRISDIGNAGSFFKNPVVNKETRDRLLSIYQDIPWYSHKEDSYKLSAGWLIEALGYKGFTKGSVGTYQKHALVLVNHGGANGSDVLEFAQEIMDKVYQHFGIILEPEVQIIH